MQKAITFEEFLAWCQTQPIAAQSFFEDYVIHDIYELEEDDYFGTEGFDKRFA